MAIVTPRATIFSEHPVVVIDKNVSADKRPVIDAFVQYLWSDEAQKAFVKHHFLEFACRGQVAALAGGTKIVIPDEATAEFAARQMEIYKLTEKGGRDWAACLRLADRLDGSYRL